MKTLFSLVLAAALCASASAQKMGSANTNRPVLQQTIMAGDAKMSLNYTSIILGSGQMFDAAMDKEKGVRARTRINNTAKSSPLGEFTTSVDVMCGDTKIPAGTYQLGFTISEELGWEANFMSGDKSIKAKLNLVENPEPSKSLKLCLYAGDEQGAGVYISYGSKMGFLEFTPADKGDAKKG